MSEKHDVTQSSNPDVQALLGQLAIIANAVTKLVAEVQAIQSELASLPQSYVVPGPAGEVPAGTVVSGTGEAKGTGDGGLGTVTAIKPAKVKAVKAAS